MHLVMSRASRVMSEKLPPGQNWIKSILRWNTDHPGIVRENPRFDPNMWRLTVNGEVQNPLTISWNELLALPAVECASDFHCVEGWSVADCRWFGTRIGTLMETANPKPDVKYVLFECMDGYTTSLLLPDLLKEDAILAYKLNGEFLEESLGGPLRLVVPGKYAYKSAMWVKRIAFASKNVLGYWEKRGYSDTANVWKNDRFSR